MSEIESLTPACRAVLQKLIPEVKEAVSRYEQAEAGLQLLMKKR